MHMTLVARALERIGDNAVDIGEQVAFVVTGLFREFSDSSRPPALASELTARGRTDAAPPRSVAISHPITIDIQRQAAHGQVRPVSRK